MLALFAGRGGGGRRRGVAMLVGVRIGGCGGIQFERGL